MNKFNLPRRNIQQERRAKRSEKRRLQSCDSNNKITIKAPARAPSGKRARKLEKKWRQAQKEAIQSGLVTMHDIEMMAMDGDGDNQESSEVKTPKSGRVFHMKRRTKIRAKVSSKKGKQVSEQVPPGAEAEGGRYGAMIVQSLELVVFISANAVLPLLEGLEHEKDILQDHCFEYVMVAPWIFFSWVIKKKIAVCATHQLFYTQINLFSKRWGLIDCTSNMLQCSRPVLDLSRYVEKCQIWANFECVPAESSLAVLWSQACYAFFLMGCAMCLSTSIFLIPTQIVILVKCPVMKL